LVAEQVASVNDLSMTSRSPKGSTVEESGITYPF
jgi:hypothetical protein